MWSHFWGTFLGKCENTQIHLLHMIQMGHDTVCLEGFRHARAAAAAMCTLSYFLQGILAPGRRAKVIEGVRDAQ